MSWGKVDDKLHGHPKRRRAGWEAMGVWVVAMSYCHAYSPDGGLDEGGIKALCDGDWRLARRVTLRLVEAGLWERTKDGSIVFHDWAEYLPKDAQAVGRKEKAKHAAKVRWEREKDAPSNAQALLEHDAQTDASRARAPVPSRPVPSPSPSETLGAPPAPPSTARVRKPRPAQTTHPGADPPRPESPTETAWRIWRATYKASGRGYGEYADGLEDGKEIKALAAHAAKLAADPPAAWSSTHAVDPLEALLGHWFRAYLRDHGSKTFSLPENKHALRFFRRGITAYGTPWAKAALAEESGSRRREAPPVHQFDELPTDRPRPRSVTSLVGNIGKGGA